MGMNMKHSDPLLVFEAPECLNRLWFIGRILRAAPLDGDCGDSEWQDFIGLVLHAGLQDISADVGRSAAIQWKSLWDKAIKSRTEEVMMGGAPLPARLDIPACMDSLIIVESVVEDVFRGWWAPPVGARSALLWLIDQVCMQLESDRFTLARRSNVTHVDIVGCGRDVALVDRYVKVGAGALFPPKESTLARIFGAGPEGCPALLCGGQL